MSTLIQIATPVVRAIELIDGVGDCTVINPALIRLRSQQFRAFNVGFIVDNEYGGEYVTVPAGTDYEYSIPRRNELGTCSLKLAAGPDFLNEGDNQIISAEIWRLPVDFSELLEFEGNVPRFVITFTDPSDNSIVGRYSDIGYADPDSFYYWPALTELSSSKWSIDIGHLQPQNKPFTIKLLNIDNMVADLAAIYRDLTGLEVDIKLLYVQGTGLQAVREIYEGTSEISDSQSNSREIAINVNPILGKRTSGFQRVVSQEDFPNVLERDAGYPMNIVAGEIASTNGALYVPVIDPAATRLLISQGRIKSVDLIRRKRNNQYTSPAFTTGYDSTLDYTYADVSGHAEGDEYYANLTGIENVGDGSGTAYLNPADQLQQLAIRHMGYVAGDFDTTSWSAFATYCTAQGFEAAGVSAIALPWKQNSLVKESVDVFAKAAQSFDVAFYLDYDGKVAVATEIDISQYSADPSALASITAEIDLAAEDISNEKSSIQYYNVSNVKVGIEHSSPDDVIDSYDAEDRSSIDFNDGNRVEGPQILSFLRDKEISKVVAGSRLLRAAGQQRKIRFPNYDMRSLEILPGQRLLLSHPVPGIGSGPYEEQEVLVESIMLDHANLRTSLSLVEVGKTFGPIVFPGEAESVFEPTLDTWIGTILPDTAHGSDTQLQYGTGLGGAPGDEQRLMSRFNLLGTPIEGDVLAGTETLESVTLEWYVNESNNDRAGILNGTIRKLDNSDYGNNSTYNNFTLDGAGVAWTDAAFLTDIWAQVGNFAGSRGWKSQVLNATALSELQTVLAGAGVFNLGFSIGRFGGAQAGDDTNEYLYIGSVESDLSWRLRVKYRIV